MLDRSIRFARKFGDPSEFAVEFAALDDLGKPADGWGKLWLYVNGQIVGNSDEIEMIIIGLGSLRESANEDRAKASLLVAELGAGQAIEAVMWAHYDSTPAYPQFAGHEDTLASLEVLPRNTGPFFDGWEAVLLARGREEQFVYRRPQGEVIGAVLPVGTFRRVINQAFAEFEQLILTH
jgi:hypothetical protein